MNLDFSNVKLFNWTELYNIEFELEIGLDAFKSLITIQEKAILDAKNKFQARIDADKDLDSLDGSYNDGYYRAFYEREETVL